MGINNILDDFGEKAGKKFKEARDTYYRTAERVDRDAHGMSDKTLERKFQNERNLAKKMAMGNEIKKRRGEKKD